MIESKKRITCCICGKQAVRWHKKNLFNKNDITTTFEGARAGFSSNEIFCGYCVEDNYMDEDGLFPEE